MTLKIQVTTAGRAALVNAENTGTLPVTVAKIGVTDQAFVADALLTELPGQLKQLDTFSGSAVAADTIHVTLRDFSTDTYSLRGFGLFFADGTLFAVYGDDSGAVILEKSAQAAMLLATDVIFADIDAAALTFGDTNFLNPPATTEVQGVVEMATDQESIDGDDGTRAVPPKGLLAALNARLGAAAPSTFVKTLLTAATAAALRVLIDVKGAALYDAGAGNGLDADKLDGQHGAYYLAWANLQNVPASFPPSAHNHDASAITTGTVAVARGGTGASAFTAGSYLVGNGPGAFGSQTPAQVLANIGAAPVVHSHAIAAVNGLQIALDGKLGTNANAVSASKLQTARSISLGGLLGGTAEFNGTLDVTIVATMADGALSIAKTAGLQTALNARTLKVQPNGDTALSWEGGAAIKSGAGGGSVVLTTTLAGGDLVEFADVTGNAVARVNYKGGLDLFSGVVNSATDLSRHLSLWGGEVGLSVTAGHFNYITNAASQHNWYNGGTNTMTLSQAGNLTVVGTGNFQGSDVRFKRNIRLATPRPLHRALGLYDYQMIHSGEAGRGVLAQHLKATAPQYVGEIDISDNPATPKKRLTVNYAGTALEVALWAAQEVDRVNARLRRQRWLAVAAILAAAVAARAL